MYCLYEKFESIKAVLNTGRETHNLEIQYKYNTNTVYFLLYSIQVFFPKKYIDHRAICITHPKFFSGSWPPFLPLDLSLFDTDRSEL